jgi:hypothetical protein
MSSARKKKNLMSRLALLVLGTFACLLLAVFIPMVAHKHGAIDPSLATTTYAAEIDLTAGGNPVTLSVTPRLVLNRGWLTPDPRGDTKDAPRLNLQNPEFALDLTATSADAVDADQRSQAAAGDPTAGMDGPGELVATLYEKLIALGFDQLTIRNGSLRVIYADGVETIAAIDAEISGRRKGLVVSKGAFSLRGQRLTFDATAGMPVETAGKANGQKPKIATVKLPLQATVNGTLFQASFDGRMETSSTTALKGQIDATAPNLRDVAQWLGVSLQPGAFAEPLSVKSPFAWSSGQMTLDKASITLSNQPANGSLALGFNGVRPSVDATLAFQSLDVTPLVTAALPTGQSADQLSDSWQSMDARWPLARQLDADFRLSAAKVMYNGSPLGRGAATVSMRSGRLNIDVAELTVRGTPVNAQIAVNMANAVPAYHVRGRLDLADLGPLSANVFGRDLVSGKAIATLDMTGSGAVLRDLMQSADGRLSLRSSDPVAIPGDVRSVRAQAQIQGRDNPAAGWGVVAKRGTTLDSLDLRATVKDGVASIEHGAVRANNQWLVTKGQVDLRQQALDLFLVLRPARAQDRSVKPVDLREADLITLKGPWSEPAFRLADTLPMP